MPGTLKKSFADGGYNIGAAYESRDHYPRPDSPSAFSQITTATRRDEMVEEEDPDAPVIIRVISPENLRAGCMMDVQYDDERYTIEIPRGGVKEGQEFEAIIDPKQKYTRDQSTREGAKEESHNRYRTEEYSREESSRRSGNSSSSNNYYRKQHKARIYDDGSEFTEKENRKEIEQIHTYPSEEEDENKDGDAADEKTEDTIWYDSNGTPMGGWRTRMCSCCDVVTQSTFWTGLLCAPILMAQIITRLKLTWNGREGPPEQTSLSFNKLILSLVLTMALFWIPVMGSMCLFAYYLVVIVYVGSQVRAYMRQRYKIPSTLPTRCGDRIDDVCMMLFCGCCSTIQMARHTHDDKDHPGHGCTTTGLEFDAPEIV